MSIIIWKRNDGQLGACEGSLPSNYRTGGAYRSREGAGLPVTFEEIGRAETWPEVDEFCKNYRSQIAASDDRLNQRGPEQLPAGTGEMGQ